MLLFVDGSNESNAERSGTVCRGGLLLGIAFNGFGCPIPNPDIVLSPAMLFVPIEDWLFIVPHPA